MERHCGCRGCEAVAWALQGAGMGEAMHGSSPRSGSDCTGPGRPGSRGLGRHGLLHASVLRSGRRAEPARILGPPLAECRRLLSPVRGKGFGPWNPVKGCGC